MSATRTNIYLDNCATTVVSPGVAFRMAQMLQQPIANSASQHRPGRRALSILEDARDTLLNCLEVDPAEFDAGTVIWTSGGTEANNLAIYSMAHNDPRSGWIVVGATEHPSILEAAKLPGFDPGRILLLPVNSSGIYDLDVLSDWIASGKPIAGVSLMLGNNETGVIQDIAAAATLCATKAIPLHCDIVQAVGKVPISLPHLGAAAVTISAHKIHGPVGIGALVLNPRFKVLPYILGGGQQLGMRAGTEPVLLADSLATAVRETEDCRLSGEYARVAQLRDLFEQRVCRTDRVSIIGQSVNRLPHTSNLAFEGLDRQAVQMALDLEGIACSTGSACSSGSSRPSHVLLAMHLPKEQIEGSIRFSFSRFTTEEDVVLASEQVCRVIERLRRLA